MWFGRFFMSPVKYKTTEELLTCSVSNPPVYAWRDADLIMKRGPT